MLSPPYVITHSLKIFTSNFPRTEFIFGGIFDNLVTQLCRFNDFNFVTKKIPETVKLEKIEKSKEKKVPTSLFFKKGKILMTR